MSGMLADTDHLATLMPEGEGGRLAVKLRKAGDPAAARCRPRRDATLPFAS